MKSQLTMKERVEYYLNDRRRLGYKLRAEGSLLLNFANYVDKSGYKGPITTDIAIKWAVMSKKKSRLTWARRLERICIFSKYYRFIEPKTEIPPCNFFGPAHRRFPPHIYSQEEIQILLAATQQLKPHDGIRSLTFKYFVGLLVTTGLRISEALSLTYDDIDFVRGIITVKETKNNTSRYVPLHITTIQALQNYVSLRNQYEPISINSSFFIIEKGKSLNLAQAEATFRYLRKKLGWSRKLRLYDFRHTFVCWRLLIWYQEGENFEKLIPFLSVYLGHTAATSTYWYMTAVPELMALVSNKFEQLFQEKRNEKQK